MARTGVVELWSIKFRSHPYVSHIHVSFRFDMRQKRYFIFHGINVSHRNTVGLRGKRSTVIFDILFLELII